MVDADDQPSSEQWKSFERQVARLLHELDPGASVNHNVHVLGRLSGHSRQVDALVYGNLVGQDVIIVAECKRYMKRIGIGLVDEMIGKVLDIGAEMGIMYAFAGYTAPAAARAASALNPKIKLLRLPDDADFDYGPLIEDIKFGDCPNANCITGDISWRQWEGIDGSLVTAGHCNSCGTAAVECEVCGEITALTWGEQSCDGCETVYEEVVDRKGIFESFRRIS
jgi:hypothetical protein